MTLHEIKIFNAALKPLFFLRQFFDDVGHVNFIVILMYFARGGNAPTSFEFLLP